MKNLNPVMLFCSDLDGTLLGEPESTRRFKTAWEAIPSENRPLLVYSTGRFEEEVYDIVEQQVLPRPDYVICAVGTRIYRGNIQEEDLVYREQLNRNWDREQVNTIMREFTDITPQPEKYQNSHKSSWYLEKDDPQLVEHIRQAFEISAMHVTVVYSSTRDLDILPAAAGKGKALRWLNGRLGIRPDQVLVAGNTGNDSSMFLIDGVRGILVSNATSELRDAVRGKPVFQAALDIADGVVEGLSYFGLDGIYGPKDIGKKNLWQAAGHPG